MKKIIVILFLCSTSNLLAQKASQEFFSELGFNVVVSKNLAKRYSDSSELFLSLLKTNGLDDVGKIQKMVLEKTGSSYSVLREEDKEKLILVYLKQNPDLASKILYQIPKFQQEVLSEMTLEQFFKEDKSILSGLKTIFAIEKRRLKSYKSQIQKTIQELMNLNGIKEAYSAGNPEIVQLVDGLNELLKSIE